MNYADALEEMLNEGIDSLWRTVAALPADKLDWQPEPTARSARALIEEIVMTTGYSAEMIRTAAVPDMAEFEKGRDLSALEKEHRANAAAYIAAVKAFPEGRLHEKLALPWGESTFLSTISYPYWNLMYHYGQIAYIETLLGDLEVH